MESRRGRQGVAKCDSVQKRDDEDDNNAGSETRRVLDMHRERVVGMGVVK